VATVDRIVVTQDGVTKTYNPTTWKALSLPERVALIRIAKFYIGATEVPGREAVVQLRANSA
jgi:hypothetical protein